MAKTSNRKINIYINGKQVENNVKSIRGAMRKLQNEQAKMTIGSKQYIKATEKIKDLNKVLDKHYTAIGRTARGWKKLAGEIKTISISSRYYQRICKLRKRFCKCSNINVRFRYFSIFGRNENRSLRYFRIRNSN